LGSRPSKNHAAESGRLAATELSGLKRRLHDLVEEIPEAELHAARRYLEFLVDHGEPVLAAMRRAALEEPEALSEKDVQALREAYEDLDAGQMLSHEEVKKRWLGES
jgi:hypothetical protein